MRHQRLVLGFILLLLLTLLMVYYHIDHNNHIPDAQYILDHYGQFTTTNVVLDGIVTQVDTAHHTLLLQVTSSPENKILVSTTTPLDATQPGDRVELYGNFTNRTNMVAENLLIYEQWNYNLIFLRSLPAIPFVLFLFFSTYRFNSETRRFERRKPHA
jgi:hypothetical protein